MKSGICHLPLFARRLHRQANVIDGIEVRGDPGFQHRTEAALRLLRPLAQFEVIKHHLGRIRQGQRSGMKAWGKIPTFTVGDRTSSHSALWYAGAIAHDAYHAKLYRDADPAGSGVRPDADAWTGIEAEKHCLAFQRQVLEGLAADDTILNYIDLCARNPVYQGHNRGWRSWLDYIQRGW
jgi:hypothetical protein